MKGRADVPDGTLLAGGGRVWRVFAPPWWHLGRWAWWWWASGARPILRSILNPFLARHGPIASLAVGRVAARTGRGGVIEVRVVETEEKVAVPEPRRKVSRIARQSLYRRRGPR